MHKQIINFINDYVNFARNEKENLLIVFIVNVKNITEASSDYSEHSIASEYYSLSQYEEITQTIMGEGYLLKSYFDENDFINDIALGTLRNNCPNKILVINTSQKGTSSGRHSLIPAFCQLHNIAYVGSDADVKSLARNKFNWYCYLKELGFPVCPSWLYSNQAGWVMNSEPEENTQIILKLNQEASSIGLTSNNVLNYDEKALCSLEEISTTFRQEVIAQKFISGYEVEIPILISTSKSLSLFPAGVTITGDTIIGDHILDYNCRNNHNFSYYDFTKIKPKLAQKLMETSSQIAAALGIKDYGRIDYRITLDEQFYITDIATNPHITKSMTFQYAFNQLKLPYSLFLETLIGLGIKK